jgi:Holliday junction DNA helicase RuvB
MENHRPSDFSELVGQEALKSYLTLLVDSSLIDNSPLPSILLVSNPGLGKSTIIELLADQALQPLEFCTAPVDDKYLTTAVEGGFGIFAVDEIHALTRRQQEYLLPVVEDRIARDRRGNSMQVDVTIIGATTDGDKVIRPLWDRFRHKPTFDPYTDEEITMIIGQMAAKFGMEVDLEWCQALVGATMNVPRRARNVVETARRLQLVNGELPSPEEVLAALRTTDTGLTTEHLRYLTTLQSAGDIAGLDTMRQLLGYPAGHIELLEVDLIRQGLLIRGGRGREMTNVAKRLVRSMA